MDINYNNKNLLGYPLPDVLERFYSAAVLKPFAELYLYPLFPDLRDLQKPRKADITAAFLSLQNDRETLKALVNSFSPELIKCFEVLLWTSWIGLEELESQLGFEITCIHPNFHKLRYRDLPFQFLPGFELIAIDEVDTYFYGGRYGTEPQK
jgi:hypothetical protein